MVYRYILLTTAICTSSIALAVSTLDQQEKQADSVQEIKPPLGLPPIPWPKDNPYSKEKAELGRLLYFDKRLSSNETVSCATCHNMPCGFSDCQSIAIGIDQTKGTRHSPTIINSAYLTLLFWDGRANSLEDQSKGPLANPKEMTKIADPHEAHKYCVECVQKIDGYKPLFRKAFGSAEINLETISKAIATFERTVLSGNSPYDRYKAGDRSALTQEQIRGMELFKKKDCIVCHVDPTFTDGQFHNIGVGMNNPNPNPDLGRYAITNFPSTRGAFKTPGLRETSRSGPYMHDGSLHTLREVIDYYNDGGIKNKNLHPLMRPLHLTEEDKKALISFLEALNGEGWQHATEPKEFPQ